MIAVVCRCSYSTQVPEQFSGKTVACPRCGQIIGIGPMAEMIAAKAPPMPRPAPSAAPSASPAVERVRDRCAACSAEIPIHGRQCIRCGWCNKDDCRKCLQCEMPVLQHDGLGFGSMQGGVTGIIAIAFGWLFGWLAGLSLFCALGAIGGLMSVFTMGYRCTTCARDVPPNLLSADEKSDLQTRKTKFIMGAVGLGILSVILGIVYIILLWMVLNGRI